MAFVKTLILDLSASKFSFFTINVLSSISFLAFFFFFFRLHTHTYIIPCLNWPGLITACASQLPRKKKETHMERVCRRRELDSSSSHSVPFHFHCSNLRLWKIITMMRIVTFGCITCSYILWTQRNATFYFRLFCSYNPALIRPLKKLPSQSMWWWQKPAFAFQEMCFSSSWSFFLNTLFGETHRGCITYRCRRRTTCEIYSNMRPFNNYH